MRPLSTAFLLAATIGLAATSAEAANLEAPLILERTIPLENVSGRIDHLAIDVSGKRLFIAELGNGSVDIVDLPTGKAAHRISGLKEPQGVAYIPDQDLLVVASAGDGSVRFFRAADLSPLGTIDLGDDADNIRIDPTTRHVLVGYGDGGLAVVDAASRSRIGDIKLAGHPEGFQIDPKTNRAYVNIPDAHQIAVVDLGSQKQVSTWEVPGPGANFPIALSGTAGALAVVFRSPPTLALLDPVAGRVTQRLATCGDADDVFFDGRRDRIYVSCGDGSIDVIERNAQRFRSAGRIPTSSGARTSLFAPDLDRLFVAARAGSLGSQASILVFRPSP
jgi:DNA-binding beta-propeller fold protein YncE